MIKTYAQWDTQELLILSLPHKNSDWKPYLEEILSSYERLVAAVTPYQKVILIAPNLNDFTRFKKFKNIEFLTINTNDTWIRDYGAIDVLFDGKTVSYNFEFNAWGCKFESSLDNLVNKKLFSHLNGKLIDVPLILEGGSIDFNGQGVMMTTSHCLLNNNRNQLSKDRLEDILKELFGLNRIIWLNNGFIKGDDTDRHIDTLARFITPETIVYCACCDKNDEHYFELKKMEEELKNTGFNLVPLFLPKPVIFENRRLGATYCNFIFINNALIVPTYNDKENDKIAIATLQKNLPNLDVVGVDATIFIRQNGSLHCSSQNRFKGIR